MASSTYRWTESAVDTFNELRGLGVAHYGEDRYWNNIREFVSEDDWDWLWSDRSARRRCMGAGRSYADGVKAARELEKLTRVVIMTSRPANVMDITMRWCSAQHLRPHALVHIAMPAKKWNHELMEHCRLFVDDNPDNCREIRNKGIPTFCPARLYNRELKKEKGIVRFESWDVVIDWVRENINAEEGPRG